MNPNNQILEKYLWAVNVAKLMQAVKAANDQKLLNPSFDVTDESVRAEYVKRGGLLSENKIQGRKISKKAMPTDDIESDEGAETVLVEGMNYAKKGKKS